MNKLSIILIFIFTISVIRSQAVKVKFNVSEHERKVDVLIDGKLFTSYLYPDSLDKQILYPLFTASGKEITRGFPLKPRLGEQTDHPHQLGMWFNFGDVNGLDFWNNSYAIPISDKFRYGTIRHRRIVKSDELKGALTVESYWENSTGDKLLLEESSFVFGGNDSLRSIVRITKLTALKDRVVFTENKEGMFALRMDQTFEEPAGQFRNSEGKQMEKNVFGGRSAWVALSAVKENEIITVALLDHPDNVGYPAWSFARGYGLFALNNLGARAFDKSAAPLVIILKQGEYLVFKHAILIKNGLELSDDQINAFSFF